MKIKLTVLLVILVTLLGMTGCSKQQTITFYVGDEALETVKIEVSKNTTYQISQKAPIKEGKLFEKWIITDGNAKIYLDFLSGVSDDSAYVQKITDIKSNLKITAKYVDAFKFTKITDTEEALAFTYPPISYINVFDDGYIMESELTNLVIPSKYQDKTVSCINLKTFYKALGSLTLPETCSTLIYDDTSLNITEFIVNAGNPYIYSREGSIYKKADDSLVISPKAKN